MTTTTDTRENGVANRNAEFEDHIEDLEKAKEKFPVGSRVRHEDGREYLVTSHDVTTQKYYSDGRPMLAESSLGVNVNIANNPPSDVVEDSIEHEDGWSRAKAASPEGIKLVEGGKK